MKFLLVLIFVVGLFMSDIAAVLSEIRQDGITSRGKRSTESSPYFFYQQPEYPRDCKEVYDQCEDQTADGVYLIKPEGSLEPFEGFCNNSIDGGGWTVFQRRLDGSVDFYRYLSEYKHGFGFLRGEFWLGNDKIANITNQKTYELRIDMKTSTDSPILLNITFFRISDEGSKYRLVGIGDYDSESTANYDGLPSGYHKNQSFCTRDRDNDRTSSYHLATYYHGAWWFGGSNLYSHLNGIYSAGSAGFKSIYWYNFPGGYYHLKYSEMKIRPLQDSYAILISGNC